MARIAGAVLLVATLGACAETPTEKNRDLAQVDSVEAPEVGACRVLNVDDVAEPSDATRTVDCTQKHTAQTFAVGQLPADLDEEGYDSSAVGAFAYETCSAKLRAFLGADESLSLRTILTWAWFRPSPKAWDEGARWYRCDVVGGNDKSTQLINLPETAQGLLMGRPDDRWLVCVQGTSVNGAPKIPCTRPHDWRAVTTIKLGEPQDAYPGDHAVEIKTREFCSDSVGAWLNYPVDFQYGYTWFHQAEWDAGNRRSVCWAQTSD
ncbi:hypothetical protein BH11ACT8_BH11ACT8_07190 [soil metagenome]